MSKIRAYISHSIRGKHGKDATKEQMDENNSKAIQFGKELRKVFPTLDLYVPAEHDEFILEAYLHGRITEEEILDTDCNILAKRNFLLVYSPDGYISKGMGVEINFAKFNNIPRFYNYTDGVDKKLVKEINFFLEQLMR